ncbi:MAG: radical SAM family heme chaperone HemW [Paludibacteraceae bacterium]|jgi:oxygen-independent coproporphyrinogen-3 oxidase|nr:radical SAM family heme chaperone HemW [Paludibacteraceae bacterium]
MAGIYVHIPFCKSRCSYCDFYSSTYQGNREVLIQNICQELVEQKNFFLNNEIIKTIYLGGGTPSLLNNKDLNQIFETIKNNFTLDLEEVTLEANPDDLSIKKISELKQFPINRLSIGVQSFFDKDLLFINRRHTAQQAIHAIKRCQDNGFENVSIDLIYGLPNQTLENWGENIETAISLNVPHISAYHLTFEGGTKITRQRDSGLFKEIDEDLSFEMYRLLIKKLTKANISQYEISNFAKYGFESKHNSSYWNETPYLGVGPAAHSFNGKTRRWNISNSRLYLQLRKEHKIFYETENIDTQTRYNDLIITSLRTIKGLNFNKFIKTFDNDIISYFEKEISRFTTSGDIIFKEGFYALSEIGIFKSDYIIEKLLWVD